MYHEKRVLLRRRDEVAREVSRARRAGPVTLEEGWDPETARLIRWLAGWSGPPGPFALRPGVRVADPERFLAGLRADAAAGPGCGRGQSGAFQADLRRLWDLFGSSPAPAPPPRRPRLRFQNPFQPPLFEELS